MKAQEDVGRMMDDVVAGFDALLGDMKALRARNDALQRELDAIHEKQLSTPAATENGSERDKRSNSLEGYSPSSESLSVLKAQKVAEKWKAGRRPAPSKIELPQGHPEVELEQDFTTPGGTQGRLGCPFASMMAEKAKSKESSVSMMGRKGRKPGEPSLTPSGQVRDPIAAEFHSKSGRSGSVSVEDSIPQCPIRFLDQHKPEEVAQYFENHKHEIPRSHEVCIKRYQSNEQSIRQLDAKYGSLVNMIQGLGKKHQPMLEEKLPEEDEEEAASQALSDKEIAKIERWAGSVNDGPVAEPTLEQQLDRPEEETDDSRKTRFDRNLREVRLGESPSRPWGIRVPASAEEIADTEAQPTTKPSEETKETTEPKKTEPEATKLLASDPKLPIGSSMTFNGPVFFGYSAAETARLLQQVPQLQNAAK